LRWIFRIVVRVTPYFVAIIDRLIGFAVREELACSNTVNYSAHITWIRLALVGSVN
jgi:hypothetical protein